MMPNQLFQLDNLLKTHSAEIGIAAPLHLIEPKSTGLQVKFADDCFNVGTIPAVQYFCIGPGASNQRARCFENAVKDIFR
jgi:hypothetical protein